ncbi:amidohydrolase family protein [Alphaproteobacteria bacterium]|nr:amidohydrolase family protein [Alphaproteobacteria bacterium]
MSEYHLSNGTTSILPTTWTSTFDQTFNALKEYKNTNNILGVHLEGPFINPDKLGAQPPLAINPSIDFIKKLQDVAPIKVITLAPELDGMDKFIYQLNKLEINIQFGHSLADFECCAKFMNKYKIGFTHLYNAMSGNHHRNSGVLGAALELGSYAEIICDLNHVNETSIKIAKKCIKNLYAVTDSMGATGLQDGIYNFFGVDIEKKNKIAVVKKTNALAGSVINMYDTFSNLIKLKFSLNEVVKMTSYNAAQYLQKNDLGYIGENKISNILVLDKSLRIKKIYLNGIKIDE